MRGSRTLSCLLLLTEIAVGEGFPGYAALRERAQAAWGRGDARTGRYIVLVPSDSPLHIAATTLAEHRKAAIIPFSPGSPEDSLETLIRAGARYVAVFAEPAEMDVNLVRRMIVLSTLMDEDPFCDFAFGFFTATNPEQVQAFVERAVRADREGVRPYTAYCALGSNVSHKYAGSSFVKGMPGDSYYVNRWDLEFARKVLTDAQSAGFVHLGACADPEGIWLFDDARNLDASKHWPFDPAKVGQDPKGEMPRVTAAEFRRIRFDGAVVWTHACHVGSVHRMWVEGDIVSTFGRCDKVEEYVIPADRSVGLAVIEAGVSAYLAPLGPNHGAQASIEKAIASETGIPLGDVMRRSYHDVVMDTDGHPERIGVYVAGKPRRWDPDGFVNYNSPHNRALYGDPLFQPFGKHRSPATVEIEARKAAKGTDLTFRIASSGYLGRTLYGNRRNAGRGRIYEVVPVEGEPTAAAFESVEAVDAEGEAIKIVSKTALLERIDGKTFLHVQIVTDDSKALRTKGAEVRASLTLTYVRHGSRRTR